MEEAPVALNDVCLYVIVRSDLASLNPGKACAQATHAANQCVFDIRKSGEPWLHGQLVAWEGDRGFGTCIVLSSSNFNRIEFTVNQLRDAGHHACMVHDPSYPLLDGEVMHHIPLDTCAYAFGLKHLLDPFLCRYQLMT
jgi:peptidyl-tRNA hydrolase